MVRLRAFPGLTFKPYLYNQLLDKDLQHLEEASNHKFQTDFNWEELVQEGSLMEPSQKYLYLYQQQYNQLISLGIVAELSLRDYHHKHIKGHEETLNRQKQNLNQQTIAETHIAPVVVGHRHCSQIDSLIQKMKQTKKCFASWNTKDGRKHKLWKISDHTKLTKLYEEVVDSLYILDGHHRFRAAYKHFQKQGKGAHEKDEWILGIVYSSQYIKAFSQYRELVDPRSEEILSKIMKDEMIEAKVLNDKPNDLDEQSILLIYKQKYYLIKERQTQVRSKKLGVQLLNQILQKVKKRMVKNQHQALEVPFQILYRPALFYTKEEKEARQNPIFIVKSPTIEQIFDHADNGKMFPPKSTWLEPKPCLHMIIRLPY